MPLLRRFPPPGLIRQPVRCPLVHPTSRSVFLTFPASIRHPLECPTTCSAKIRHCELTALMQLWDRPALVRQRLVRTRWGYRNSVPLQPRALRPRRNRLSDPMSLHPPQVCSMPASISSQLPHPLSPRRLCPRLRTEQLRNQLRLNWLEWKHNNPLGQPPRQTLLAGSRFRFAPVPRAAIVGARFPPKSNRLRTISAVGETNWKPNRLTSNSTP